MMRPTLVLLALLVSGPFLGLSASAAEPEPLDPRLFPVPQELSANVAFWKLVYSKFDDDKVLVHDNRHLDIIYTVIDLSDVADQSETRQRLVKRKRIEAQKTLFRRVLSDLAAGRSRDGFEAQEERVASLFADIPGGPAKYRAAMDRIRHQTCLRNQFAEAVERSGLYMETFEETFARRGLPTELARLPFVESMFRNEARSKAAASGLFQFMASTARSYLTMSAETDERHDPFRAADAAARLLARNHERLGTWPLALTAYNHGANGMARAVRKLGTRDIGTISRDYRSRTFGFASRNFYSEFVAAASVYHHRERHFPGFTPMAPLSWDEFVADHYVATPTLAREAGIELADLRQLNPGLSREIWSGDLYLPKQYTLRVPRGSTADFQTAYAGLSADDKLDHQTGLRYRVRRG
ncbi:MAG: transglycosylase SLT domain-containing protein, partial [Acidobacteriota bacterium]